LPECRTVDSFPSFLECWQTIESEAVEEQVAAWLADFAARWPELAAALEQAYAEDGLEWRSVLQTRVFPHLPERLPTMARARGMLLECAERVCRKAQKTLGLDFDVVFVVLAIGYGGWATTYEGARACLLGLDTIAECGWADAAPLSGLIAHELGHLIHQQWRADAGLTNGEGPLWQLYEEGFAQRCEHLALGHATWHMQEPQEDWLQWCQQHRSWLAGEFLRTIAVSEPAYAFFGSWPEYHVQGRHQCGYFLGHEVVAEWEREAGICGIALMRPDSTYGCVRQTLERMARESR